jgi:hypothetical protein
VPGTGRNWGIAVVAMKWLGIKGELMALLEGLYIAAVILVVFMIAMGVYDTANRQEFEDQRKPFEQYLQENNIHEPNNL